MALNIKDRETEEVVRQLAKRTGRSITEAVKQAAIEKLDAVNAENADRKALLRTFIERARSLPKPDRDPRTDDEILGYNERGTFD
jgi:antitoxin VapB